MYVKFEELAEDSRVWIYQSSRDLSAQEISKIATELKGFLCDVHDSKNLFNPIDISETSSSVNSLLD